MASGISDIAPTERRGERLLSVVVPCFDEAAVVRDTHARLGAVLSGAGIAYELIFVDDGSRDATLAILQELRARDPSVRVLALSRNFGHQVAVTAGLEHAAGDAVAIIDADLQDPPEVIPRMLARWREGVDVAYGERTLRQGETAFKRWSAGVFYRLLRRLSDTPIPLDTGDFRLMDRRVVEALLAMPERDRFVRGMVAWLGFRQEAVAYVRAPRHAGETKYPLRRMLAFATDGLLSFSTAPLRLAITLGLMAAAMAMGGIVYALALRLFTEIWVTGWTLLFIAVLFIGGVQLVFLGLVGEYVGRIYGEVKRRPLYLLRAREGFGVRSERPAAPVAEGRRPRVVSDG